MNSWAIILSLLLAAPAAAGPRTVFDVQHDSEPGTIRLPGHYRADDFTCRSGPGGLDRGHGVLAAMADAVGRIQSDLLGCLRDVNPEAADAFLAYISAQRPVIYCGGRESFKRHLRNLEYGSPEKSAASESFDRDQRANAVATPSGKIILWTADPYVNDQLLAPAKPLTAAVPKDTDARKYTREERMEVRQRNYPAYAPEPQLISLLFHETMHLAKFATGQTAHERTDPTDEVYQCTMVCSGPKSDVTPAGCLGCMKAEGHVVTDADRRFCERFFAPAP